jgi:hypothetical protein
LKEGVIEEKEKQIMFELMEKYNMGGHQPARDDDNQSRTSSDILFGAKGSSKKREAADKDDTKSTRTSKSGRFEAKYKVGDRTTSGSIIKEVREEYWKFVRKDQKGNSYFECTQCSKQMRNDNRRTHVCV